MRIDFITIIGLIAASCTTLALVPQAIKSWRTRETHDISLLMYTVLVAGTSLWLIYGLLIGDMPLILANVVSFGLTISILYLKIRYG